MKSTRTRKIAIIAMLSAIAYVLMVVGRVPIVPGMAFLKYDPKDVIIVIGGLLYGPLASAAMAGVVSLIEMFSVSETGIYGLIMNIVQSCAFACTAAVIYKYKRNISGAIIGLTSGWLLTTAVMLLWNYLITPIYMGMLREIVAEMILPVFLPFNLLKGGLNAAFTILLYKPIRAGLDASRLMPRVVPSASDTGSTTKGNINSNATQKSKINAGLMIAAAFVVITGILLILAWQGII